MPETTGQEDVPLPLNGGAALAANVHRSSGAERLAEPADSPARPVTRRWTEQRWILDNVIQANGVDWDQPRTHYWNAACGLQAAPDFARVRQRVHKYADIAPEFADMARIREERALGPGSGRTGHGPGVLLHRRHPLGCRAMADRPGQ